MTTTVTRPEPVTGAGALAGAIAALLLAVGGLLRGLGWLPVGLNVDDLANGASSVVLAAAGLWALVGPWLLARFRARPRVTPLADPRDDDGRPLLSPQLAVLVADFPEFAGLVPQLLGAGGLTEDVVRDHLERLRELQRRRADRPAGATSSAAPATGGGPAT